MDVVARLHGGGVSAQAGALRHGISRALLDADPNLRGELKRRGFLTRDAARQGAQEGRPQEGAQAAAVLQALGSGPHAARRKLFGTDGVRGVAGEVLTAELALALGRAASEELRRRHAPQVLVIRDTRESGEMLEAALAAGVTARRRRRPARRRAADARRPRCCIGRYGFDLAAVISASHNPYRDNGIKLFGARRLQARRRRRAGDRAPAGGDERTRCPTASAACATLHGTLEDYLRELHARFAALDLTGVDVLLDCANGATFRAAPEIFRRLGRDGHRRSPTSPTAATSTTACGSTHVEAWAAAVVAGGHDARLRLRRRRRPRAGGRPHRRGRRRRRADRPGGAAPARRRPPARRRRRGDGDDQLRLPRRDGGGRHRGRDHQRRRPLRARGAARAAAGRWAASSPATSSTWASTRPATASPARC